MSIERKDEYGKFPPIRGRACPHGPGPEHDTDKDGAITGSSSGSNCLDVVIISDTSSSESDSTFDSDEEDKYSGDDAPQAGAAFTPKRPLPPAALGPPQPLALRNPCPHVDLAPM